MAAKRYKLYRQLPDGTAKAWTAAMRPIEVRRAVYSCLTDNRITDSSTAKAVAERLEDHPDTPVECNGYRFWTAIDDRKDNES